MLQRNEKSFVAVTRSATVLIVCVLSVAVPAVAAVTNGSARTEVAAQIRAISPDVSGPADAFQPAVRLSPPSPAVPPGCLQYPTAADTNGVFVINPNQYQRVAATRESGPNGPIIVIGDSLTWGRAADTAAQLRTAGWGPVCVSGTISATVQFGTVAIPDGLDAIARIRASSTAWQGLNPKIVVALGTNDVGFSGTSLAAAKSYVTAMLSAIGPTEEPVSWMTVRTKRAAPWPTREITFNQAISASGVALMPWATEFQNAWVSADLVHCTVAGNIARVAMYGRL